jgi:hypothetical protein
MAVAPISTAKRIAVSLGVVGGLGGALTTGAIATCPIAQGAALGALGTLGLSPCAPSELRPLLYAAVVLCGAVFAYTAIRMRRRRHDMAMIVASSQQ